MTHQANSRSLFPDGVHHPIVRPLPMDTYEGTTVAHAADRLRSVLFRVDEGWYDAYWYGQQSHSKLHLLGRAVLDAIVSARFHRHMWPLRRGASGVDEHNAALVVAENG